MMVWFDCEYRNGRLFYDGVDLTALVDDVGTPCYVYSRSRFEANYRAYEESLADIPHLICYSVKANQNLAILKMLANLGSGADILTGGELFKVRKVGIPGDRIIFSGVAKNDSEIREALDYGVLLFNVESEQELDRISEIASRTHRTAGISIRVNPDIDPGTHPKITTGMRENKFGLAPERAMQQYRRAMQLPNLEVRGIEAHIGSQIMQLLPFIDEMKRLLTMVDNLRDEGIPIRYLSTGGGLGAQYRNGEEAPTPQEFCAELIPLLAERDLTWIIEPGRSIAGTAGMLVTRVLYTKDTGFKKFVIVDAGMTELARPMLYDAYHKIIPLREPVAETETVDVVGPICETTDRLAVDREIPVTRQEDLLAFGTAGAYGFVMASNYNARFRPPEVLIENGTYRIIRERENYEDLIRGEIF
jgi:diaminopimelate decarboxylase